MPEISDAVSPTEQQKADIAKWPIEKEMRKIVATGDYLNPDIVYPHLATALPYSEIVDKIRSDYSKDISTDMIARITKALGREYVRLLVEPSISTRVDEFIVFAQGLEVELGETSIQEIRNKFKVSLGKRKVYRFSAARSEDMSSIQKGGFISNFYRGRTPQSLQNNKDGYESMKYNMSDLQGGINVHAGAFASTEKSMFISVSDYPQMAEYAGFVQLKDKWPAMTKQGYKLYLFPIEVDEFHLIHYGKYLKKTIEGDGVWRSDEVTIPYDDPGVELWAEFSIPPEKIDFNKVVEVPITAIPKFKYESNSK